MTLWWLYRRTYELSSTESDNFGAAPRAAFKCLILLLTGTGFAVEPLISIRCGGLPTIGIAIPQTLPLSNIFVLVFYSFESMPTDFLEHQRPRPSYQVFCAMYDFPHPTCEGVWRPGSGGLPDRTMCSCCFKPSA